MKKIYLSLSIAILFSLSSYAQLTKTHPQLFKNAVSATEMPKTGNERISIPKGSYLKQAASNPSYGDVVGYTWYDLQTNAGVSKRIHQDDNGNIQVVWTKALDTITDPSVALRGIGYNYFDAGTQTWNPGDSLDAPFGISDIRVGWPSIAPVPGNDEIIFGHPRRLFSNPVKGASAYSATDLTVTLHGVTGEPFQWYNSAAEGNSIYAIAQVTGSSMEFGRSDDGGQTWAISGIFPDSASGTPLKPTGADGYDIDVKGDSVVVVSGGYTGYAGTEPNDLMIFLSTDRGATWTSTTVHVFDTTNAVLDSTTGGYNVLTPHPDARVLIASDGSIHVTGSLMAAATNQGSLTTAGWFPLTRGIWYWNTNMPSGVDFNDSADYANYVLFDSVPDMITMGSYPLLSADQPSYVAGSFTHPNLTEDLNTGDLYIVYDGVTCGSDNNPFDSFYRRDLFALASRDGGTSWNDPQSIALLLGVNDLTDGTVGEEAFPNVTKRTSDGILHILFQYDTWGGTFLVDATVLEENQMTYLALDPLILGVENSSEVSKNNLKIYPNPGSDLINISYESLVNGESNIQITNLIGQVVKTQTTDVFIGSNNSSIDISQLNRGIYLISVYDGINRITKKLVIE